MFTPVIRSLRGFKLVKLVEPLMCRIRSQPNSFEYSYRSCMGNKTASFSTSATDFANKSIELDPDVKLIESSYIPDVPTHVKDLLKDLNELCDLGPAPRDYRPNFFKKKFTEKDHSSLYRKHELQFAIALNHEKQNSTRDILNKLKEPLIECAMQKFIPYVVSSTACNMICQELGDITDPSTAILMNSPGPGILADEMLKQGAKSLHLFETNPEYYYYLADKYKQNPYVHVYNQEMTSSMWRLSTADTFNLDFLKVLNSKKYSTLKIVHCIERVGTIGIILGNHLTGFYPSDKKKVDLYFMLPCAIGDLIVNEQLNNFGRRGVRGLWEIFAINKLLTALPASCFYPTFSKKGSFQRNRRVVILLQSNFREICVNSRSLTETERPFLALFTRHHAPRSRALVINALEKWIPGIGLALVLNGIPLFTRFSDLSIDQYIEVFFNFFDRSDQDSSMWAMMEDQKFVEAKAISADSVTQR